MQKLSSTPQKKRYVDVGWRDIPWLTGPQQKEVVRKIDVRVLTLIIAR